MSDSAFYEDSTPYQSDSLSGNTVSSGMPMPPPISLPQEAAPPHIITCRLCSEIFRDPVIFSCGHTFCLSCSEKWREKKWLCPQAGCEKTLGQHVPNLIIKEASISHRIRMQLLQQQILSTILPFPSVPSPEADENQPFEQRDHWAGGREVGIRKSSRRIQTSNNRDPSPGSGSSFGRTFTADNEMKMPSIEEVSLQGSPSLSRGIDERDNSLPDDHHEEKPSTPASIARFIPHEMPRFVRGVPGRRSETSQVRGKTTRQSFCRRSLKQVFNRPKDYVSGKFHRDISLGDRPDLSSNAVWMGGQLDKDDHPYPSHSMKCKKDKSLWKRLFSSNKSTKN